jgi:hypothetical protein
VAGYAPRLIGLTLEKGKYLLATLQIDLVQGQAEDYSRRRDWSSAILLRGNALRHVELKPVPL